MPGNRYAVGGRSAATAATVDHAAVQLWNPHAAKSIYVREIWCFKTAATADNHALVRTTARGTAGSTVTPGVNNAFDRRAAPASGALLDLAAFSTQPTLATPYLARSNLAAAIGASYMWIFADEPLEVLAGTGLAIVTPTAAALQACDWTFVWDE